MSKSPHEDNARQVLEAAGIKPQYVNHGLSILIRPDNIGRWEAIVRILKDRTCPEWFSQKDEQ